MPDASNPVRDPHVKGPIVEPKGYRGLTREEAARRTPPTLLTDTEAMLDLVALRTYRLQRVRNELKRRDLAACILTTPHSLRYAAGLRNCAIYQSHIPATYLYVPAEGPTVLFDSQPGRLTGQELETIDQISPDLIPLTYMWADERAEEWFGQWGKQIAALAARDGGGNRHLALDHLSPLAQAALVAERFDVHDANAVLERARAIKSPEEILCLNNAIAVAEDGMARMREALRPGITEIALWAKLWQANIEAGGDVIECRLLASGDRTNPWQQEASSRRIRAGDLLAFDTDMVGPLGYFADISRTFFCGPGVPSARQKDLYRRAHEEIHANIELMRAGAGLREISERAFRQPERFRAQHYPCLAHGVGLSDEWPVIYYQEDARYIYDGALEAGMVLSVESYVGEPGGADGVKLEQMILVTDDAPIVLSTFPFEAKLLG